MMRDAKGRFMTQRRYRMIFDDGHREDVTAYTPYGAVIRRRNGSWSALPHTIIDLTALARWEDNRVLSRAVEVVQPAEPGPITRRVASARTDLVPMSTYEGWREAWDD